MTTFIERHADKIRGVLSCFDRVVITGTLPELCHAGAMAKYLGARGIRLFDYPRWAEPFRDTLRTHAEQLAREHGLTIEFIRRVKDFRKEERIKRLVAQLRCPSGSGRTAWCGVRRASSGTLSRQAACGDPMAILAQAEAGARVTGLPGRARKGWSGGDPGWR